MPRYSTREVLAGAYKGGSLDKTPKSHVLDTRTGKVLCGRVRPDSLLEEDDNDDAAPTCKVCLSRDPREPKDENDGPRCLKHIFQF